MFSIIDTCVALAKAGLLLGPLRPSAALFGCIVCVICNSKSFHSSIFKLLHNDCSYIEHVHLPLCAHLINIFSFLMSV